MVLADSHAIHRIAAILDEYFPDPAIPLDFSDAFTLLIAVVLSAQCTDARVNTVTPLLWEHGRRPADIASMPVEQIERIIRPCGLYTRKARAIHDIASVIGSVYGGAVPALREQLESLPCVGRKTANVILSHAFGVPAFPVDTHIMRLSGRWGLSDAGVPDGVEADLCSIFPPHEWLRRHLQMIYAGRSFCRARGHVIVECPVCSMFAP